ncbi:MAG: hypothetical protein PHS49_06330 [Candidatus Gracilibacteria bacterium]|nr:hypothetical protein [Candidatus Gracilibacteria bacterium]
MKKFISILLLIILNTSSLSAYTQSYGPLTDDENFVLSFGSNKCKYFKQSDIPTIFIPGILASWYSEEGYNESKTKRWIPDPITHSYDTLFYTFSQNGYSLRDVFYTDEFSTYIKGNPKHSLYMFGYDWKKDNKITAKILSNLVLQIREKYEQDNGCDIGTVNIIGHSMGGLVARTMLSDMCASEDDLKNYYKKEVVENKVTISNPNDGKGIKSFKSTSCDNFTRVNQLITISTPQRGSPNSFPMWTKGNMYKTNEYIQSELLQGQLGTKSNQELYAMIHGHNSKLPNGIITIGQLLPDIKKNNTYNEELRYIEQDGKKISKESHPVNSFLEELNTDENIENMFSNISGKYTSYYSTLTGNNYDFKSIIPFVELISTPKNNIVSYEVNNKTSTYKGIDIYSYYTDMPKYDVYNIEKKIINEKGLGGDGTVPTKNLLLISNDFGKRPDNTKFENIEVKCYDNELLQKNGYNLPEIENALTKKVGKLPLELCSHTKMPMLTSLQVYDKISDEDIFYGYNLKDKLKKEQELLYGYLGYADYNSLYVSENTINGYNSDYTTGNGSLDLGIKKESYISSVDIGGINNTEKLDSRFLEGAFINTFTDTEEINKFIKDKDKKSVERKELTFDGEIGAVDSLLRYEILSPINLIIEDEQGRKIGIDPETGKIVNEIPGAWTSGDTEGSNEPEFFLIPRTGTGKIMNKIHSYGTGDGEYHIVLNEIKTNPDTTSTGYTDETASFVIAGIAKKGVVENYLVGIEGNKANYKLIDSEVSTALKKVELSEKYHDILMKLYEILDKKYTKAKKQKLKKNLIKFKESKNPKFADNEKVNFLIDMIIEYIK